MKRMLFVIVSLFICLASVSCKKEQKPTLVVGLEGCYAPFNWSEEVKSETNVSVFGSSKFAEGYDVQIAKIIAEELGYELVIKFFEWNGLTPACQEGVIDLIIAGMSPIEERKIDVDFTDPYYISEHVVVISTTSSFANATTLAELNGARMIGQIGTLYERIVNNTEGFVVGNHKSKVPEIITDIKYGIVDGTVLELPVAEGIVKANSDLKMIRFNENEGFTVAEEDKVVSIGIAKGREELLQQINDVLKNISITERNEIMAQAVNAQSE